MTNDELTQHMRELLRIHTAKLSKYEPVPDETIIEAMIAARNEALEEAAKACEKRIGPDETHYEKYNAEDMACAKAIRALKVQS